MAGSLLDHDLWPELREYVRLEVYGRDRGRKPRIRIEFDPMPADLTSRAVEARKPCVDCGKPIQFVRARHPANNKRGLPRHLYYAAACPLDESIGCSRGMKAAEEYNRVENEVNSNPGRAESLRKAQGVLL